MEIEVSLASILHRKDFDLESLKLPVIVKCNTLPYAASRVKQVVGFNFQYEYQSVPC